MADDDQRDGQSVTPEGTGTTTPVTKSPTGTTPNRTGSTDRRTTKRPVRSAPIRRGRSGVKKPADQSAAAPETETVVEASADEAAAQGAVQPPADRAEKTATHEVSLAKPDPGEEIAPDPSEVEKTVSYRERRRTRLASRTPEKTGTGKVRYRGSGRRSSRTVVGVVVGIVLIVVCAVASVVFALGIARQDQQNDLRAEYSAFASQVLINLTSMNPDTVDQTLKSVQDDTSGKVKQEVQNNIQQVASLVRDGKLETKLIILSSAVTRSEPDEGSVIMVFGWHQQSLDGQTPAQDKVFRWRVDMTRINGELKMTDFEWVA